MRTGLLILVVMHLVCSAAATEFEVRLPDKHRALLQDYCFDCHDADTQKGKVNLESLPLEIATAQQAELWQKVLNAMNSGEMPPEDKRQPKSIEKADFLDALAQTMVAAREKSSDTGGEITMRRLNRREYRNSIKQLTGVTLDVASLPADGGAGSFDTVGSSLFISSDQIEQYLKLGRSAIAEVFERQAARQQPSRVFRVEPENTVNVKSLQAMRQLEENRDRFMRWKAGVDKAVEAPENKPIMARILEENPEYDPFAFPAPAGYRFYQHAQELIGAPDPKAFGFTDDNKAVFSFQGGYVRKHAYLKHYSELPRSDQGTYLKLAWGIQRIDVLPEPEDVPPGTYKLRIRAGAVESSSASRHFIEIGHPQRVNQVPAGFSGLPIRSLQVTGTADKPEIIETTLEIGINTPREFGIQERRPSDGKNVRSEFNRHKKENGYGYPPAIWIDWIELEGPIREVPESTIVRVEPEHTINPENEKQIAQLEDSYARFTRWKKGVDEAAKTPENKAKIAEIRKKDPRVSHPFLFYAFADLLKGTPNAKDFGFRDSNKAAGSHPQRDRGNLAYHKHYAALPHRDRGTYLKLAHGTGRVIVSPRDLPPGNYVMRVHVGLVPGTPAERRFIQVGHPQRQIATRNWGLEGRAISTHQVTGTIENPETIEIPLTVGAGTTREFAIQEKQPNTGNLKELWGAHNEWKAKNGYGHPPAIWIDWVELEGPIMAVDSRSDHDDWWIPGNSRLEDSSRAQTILEQFAFKAFRGAEPGDDFIQRLCTIFQTRIDAGESFNDAIELPLGIILASPAFLYLNEPGDDAARRKLTERELAVRLAYFLWSAPPDQELLDLARRSQLKRPQVLRQQVDRLIADPRSDEFVSGFIHQWLDMERLDFFQFDTTLYREFDESTRSAARQEVYHSFAHLLRARNDGSEAVGSIGKLLKSDYVFVNGLLANYYGISGVTGDQFQKVAMSAESPRGGLLGMAAIHAMGSDGLRSSPVERGAWVLRHLLHDPPPPAPPNVPQLSRLAGEPLSTREKLAVHQEEPQCASCHRKIDPIGFGLENFDAAGKWRNEERQFKKNEKGRIAFGKIVTPIDSSGQFHNGPKFANYEELRNLIAQNERDFARGFTEHLIEYALGRPYGFTDEGFVNEILSASRSKQYAVSEFIHALVQSDPFQTK